MNIFAIVILTAILLDFVINLVANLLNLKALEVEAPEPLKNIYSPDKYLKSQQYIRESSQFSLLVNTFGLVLLLIFWFAGGFNWLDLVIRSWELNEIINGLLYIGILAFVYSLIFLPFSIYSTFVIEQKYGFNKTSAGTFISDRFKALVIGVLLGAPLLAAILALFSISGTFAWLYCWAAVTGYVLFIEYIAPSWIMPLFNKFTPLEQGELRTAIFNYAASANFPIQNVFVMDGSRRSSKSNAFFTGFGRNKKIALFDTLIEKHTIPELIAILAHEIGHYKRKHIIQGIAVGIIHSGILFFLLSLFINSSGLYQAFYMDHPSVYAGLIFFSLLYTPVELVLSILLNMLSRKNEYDADLFAVLTIPDPHSMEDALKKLAADNLSNLTPHPFYAFLHYTHPPLLKRLRAIQSQAEQHSQ